MADYACDFCNHEHDCPYAYDASFCTVDRIKAAKAVVDADFSAFHKHLMAQNEQLDDDQIDCLIGIMRTIQCDSEETLPEWANENDAQEETVCQS
jgi:hypothetical protein